MINDAEARGLISPGKVTSFACAFQKPLSFITPHT